MSLSKTNHRLGNQGGGPRERRDRPRSRGTPPPSVASIEKSKAVCFWGKESGNLERCSPRSAAPEGTKGIVQNSQICPKSNQSEPTEEAPEEEVKKFKKIKHKNEKKKNYMKKTKNKKIKLLKKIFF